MKISRELINALGGEVEFNNRVKAFSAALVAHASTVNVPAPVENPLIEALARLGESYTIAEPEIVSSEVSGILDRVTQLEQELKAIRTELTK